MRILKHRSFTNKNPDLIEKFLLENLEGFPAEGIDHAWWHSKLHDNHQGKYWSILIVYWGEE